MANAFLFKCNTLVVIAPKHSENALGVVRTFCSLTISSDSSNAQYELDLSPRFRLIVRRDLRSLVSTDFIAVSFLPDESIGYTKP